MPKAFAHAGMLSGMVLLVAMAVANRYTLLLMLWMSGRTLEDRSYPEIGRNVFGRQGLVAVLLAYLLFTGGILTSYLIALIDVLQQLPYVGDAPRGVLVCVALLLCAPGAMLRSLRHVAWLSGVCMAGVCTLTLVLTFVCIGDVFSPSVVNAPIEEPMRPGDVDLVRTELWGLMKGAALFALQFSVQAGGIEVLSSVGCDEHIAQDGEVVDDALLYQTTSIPQAERITRNAYVIAASLSAAIGCAGYLRFGDHVDGDVLLSLAGRSAAPSSVLLLARVSLGFVVTCSFAFIMVPCRCATLDIFAQHRSSTDHGVVPYQTFRRVTVGILAVCWFIAFLVPDLASMLEFVAVWATMALAFVFPCAFLIEMRRREEGVPIFSSMNALPLSLTAFAVAVIISCCSADVEALTDGSAGKAGHRAMVFNLTALAPSEQGPHTRNGPIG